MSSGRPACSFLLSITVQCDKYFGNEEGILFKQTNQLINIPKAITCFTAFHSAF